MKKKSIVLAAVVLALGALIATAVAHRGEQMHGGRGMRALMQKLDLTDEQQEQLKEMRQIHREKLKEVWGEGPEAVKALHEEYRAALGKILNVEQLEKMEAIRVEIGEGFQGGKMRGHRGMWGRHCGPGRGHGAKNAFAKLDLTDAQKEQLKGLRETHREELDKLQKKHREALEKLLTDEQRRELEELKDEAFYGGKRRHRHPMW
jgi:Spy/CpxP family protein refolding chaperone